MRNMIYKNILLLKKTIKIMLFFLIKNYFIHILNVIWHIYAKMNTVKDIT